MIEFCGNIGGDGLTVPRQTSPTPAIVSAAPSGAGSRGCDTQHLPGTFSQPLTNVTVVGNERAEKIVRAKQHGELL